MTLAELERLVEGRQVIRHRGEVFINSRDPEEVSRFRALGAHTRVEAYRGQYTAEISLPELLDDLGDTDEDGDPVDTRRPFLLEHFRDRDGFSTPERFFR